jgi:hypothetical protein
MSTGELHERICAPHAQRGGEVDDPALAEHADD